MLHHLDGDQLATAMKNLVNNYSPHRIGFQELSSVLREFLLPLTSNDLKDAHVQTILELAETWRELDDEAGSQFAAMEENTGAYHRHADKAHQKLRAACNAICDGRTP